MAQGAGHNRAVSLHLSRALDEIGLNTLIVKKRRHAVLYREQMESVYYRLTGKDARIYHFGSQTEGTTTIGMDSDLDHLHPMRFFNVIEDWVDWKQGEENLLMLHENTTPGYCRLQLLRSDVPMAETGLPQELECTYDCKGFWREDNLLQCITRCLKILRYWVSDLFCPQFMINGENLFAGKVSIHNRDLLLSIITEWISSDYRALLQVKMDGLGHKLHTRLNTDPSRLPILDSPQSVILIAHFEHENHRMNAFLMSKYIVLKGNELLHMSLIPSVYQNICNLKQHVQRATKHARLALQTFIALLSCWLGSLLASLSLSRNRRIPRQAIQLMSITAKYDIASMLKLASVFYCSGKFVKVETLLLSVEDQLRRNDVLIMCRCYNKCTMPFAPQQFMHMMFVLRGKKTRAKRFAHCVRFSRHEWHCAPSALQHEMHRSIGDDIQHRDPDADNWMVLAAVDCLPYLYYMQYLTYKQLGKNDLQRCSLNNLDRCVREDHNFHHLETAWNLLGQCLEDEQDPDAAMACYRASLDIRPRNNAANWRVALLWYKLVKFFSQLPVGT